MTKQAEDFIGKFVRWEDDTWRIESVMESTTFNYDEGMHDLLLMQPGRPRKLVPAITLAALEDIIYPKQHHIDSTTKFFGDMIQCNQLFDNGMITPDEAMQHVSVSFQEYIAAYQAGQLT